MLCQRTFSSVFLQFFLHSYTAQFNVECMGPLRQLVKSQNWRACQGVPGNCMEEFRDGWTERGTWMNTMICGRQVAQVHTYSYVLSIIASSYTYCLLPIWHRHFRHTCTYIFMFGVMLSTNVAVEQNIYTWFQTFALFWMLYAFFRVILRCLNFIRRLFGILYMFHLHRRIGMNQQLHVSTLQISLNIQLLVKTHIVFDYYIYWFLAY